MPTSSDELAKPFVRAWATILFVMVQESFKKCGIPSAIDGTDNNALWFISVMTMYVKREYSFILPPSFCKDWRRATFFLVYKSSVHALGAHYFVTLNL